MIEMNNNNNNINNKYIFYVNAKINSKNCKKKYIKGLFKKIVSFIWGPLLPPVDLGALGARLVRLCLNAPMIIYIQASTV
jgi:hypothetical protein